MPNWKVELIAEAHVDFNRLDGSLKKQVLKQFVKLEQSPKQELELDRKNALRYYRYVRRK